VVNGNRRVLIAIEALFGPNFHKLGKIRNFLSCSSSEDGKSEYVFIPPFSRCIYPPIDLISTLWNPKNIAPP